MSSICDSCNGDIYRFRNAMKCSNCSFEFSENGRLLIDCLRSSINVKHIDRFAPLTLIALSCRPPLFFLHIHWNCVEIYVHVTFGIEYVVCINNRYLGCPFYYFTCNIAVWICANFDAHGGKGR